MSLECAECGRLMGPGDRLPGREGSMVHPVLQSLIYVPAEEGVRYKISYLETPFNRSICLVCIEERLPEQRKDILQRVYDCYEAETAHRRIEESQKGRLISGAELGREVELYEAFKEKLEILDTNCLFCGQDVEDRKPYFVARVIDRAYSGEHLSGLPGESNYSFSNMKQGRTNFRFCFDEFEKNFPRAFKQLSYDMLGTGEQEAGSFEFHITPEVILALESEGKNVSDFLNEIRKGGGDVKIDTPKN